MQGKKAKKKRHRQKSPGFRLLRLLLKKQEILGHIYTSHSLAYLPYYHKPKMARGTGTDA